MEDPIKYKIKNSHYYKFGGIAPDGFTLIPNETLKRLRILLISKFCKIKKVTVYLYHETRTYYPYNYYIILL